MTDSRPGATVHRDESTLRATRLLIPVLERWRFVLGGATLFAAVVVGVLLLFPVKYVAQLEFSAIGATRGGALTSSLPAALLAATSAGGLQPTPALLSHLAGSPNVLTRVARTVVPGRNTSVIDIIAGPGNHLDDVKATKKLQKLVDVTNDRETGLISLTVTYKDSSLARYIADKLVSEASAAFLVSVRAQGTEAFEALGRRVDSASSRLSRAEEAIREFKARTRVVRDFSVEAPVQSRLERDVTIAQTVFQQAATEREAARARQLEETPAVVIVSPVAKELAPVSRGIAVGGAGSFAAGLFALIVLLAAQELLFGEPMEAEAERRRFQAALRGVPLLRGLATK
jgi:uncharacterized protein involved in exopolysaccharide biosynthesis